MYTLYEKHRVLKFLNRLHITKKAFPWVISISTAFSFFKLFLRISKLTREKIKNSLKIGNYTLTNTDQQFYVNMFSFYALFNAFIVITKQAYSESRPFLNNKVVEIYSDKKYSLTLDDIKTACSFDSQLSSTEEED